MNIHRQALGLAAVLAATVLTGGAAILGITHRAAPGVSAATPAAALVQQAPAPAPPSEEAD